MKTTATPRERARVWISGGSGLSRSFAKAFGSAHSGALIVSAIPPLASLVRDRSSPARRGQTRLMPATAKNRMRAISATWVFGDMGALLPFHERLPAQKFRAIESAAKCLLGHRPRAVRSQPDTHVKAHPLAVKGLS